MNSNYKTFTFLTKDSFVVGGLQARLENELPLPAVGLSVTLIIWRFPSLSLSSFLLANEMTAVMDRDL
jgi:hypothetical protein